MKDILKRFIYLGYFILNTDYKNILSQINSVKKKYNVSYIKLLVDVVNNSFKNKMSFEDYFYLNFFNKSKNERNKYIGTGMMYEFHTKYNNKDKQKIFENKVLFLNKFKKYVNRDFLFLKESDIQKFTHWIEGKSNFFAKPVKGTVGSGIQKIKISEFKHRENLYDYLIKNKLYLLEESINQHKKMNDIIDKSINTIRIITLVYNNELIILSAMLRMSNGKVVDNFDAGGISAPIDIKDGIISGPAVSKSIDDNNSYYSHPITEKNLIDFKIPYWNEIIKMISECVYVVPGVKTVGWDISVGSNGPILIEGNHNWDKTHWQLTEKKGKKKTIKKYL